MWHLIIGHIIGDWFFQPGKWAKQKTENKKYLIYHSLVYALSVTMMYAVYKKPSIFVFLIIFITHYILDQRNFTIWWMEVIKHGKEKPVWLIFVLDQCFHIFILYMIFVFG